MNRVEVKPYLTTDFQVSEAFKTLRTNLMFSGPSVCAVGLTSFNASEGKSTISFQLAASLAESGKKVILVDADLRKSLLVNRLHVHERIDGLSHYLSGMAAPEELLCETDLEGFYILFAGARVPNSAELLGSERFQSLIEALRRVFDYVIVDAAPVGMVIDAAVMSSVLDGMVLVVDVTSNSYKLERKVKNQLEKAGGKLLGVVLNRVNFREKGSYYGKAYAYGYGYGEQPPE